MRKQLDVSLLTALGECSSSYCPYERSKNELRNFVEDKSAEGFAAYLKRFSQPKTHVLSSFASGGLFQDLRLILRFAEQLKLAGRIEEEVELNLIDKTYGSSIVDSKLVEREDGLAIKQFSQFAFNILKSLV